MKVLTASASEALAKPTSSSGCMQVKANAQALPKVNGTKVGLKAESQIVEAEGPSAPRTSAESQIVEAEGPSAPRTSYNQLPDWSFLFAAIATIFLAAEKQFTLIDWKARMPDMLAEEDHAGWNGFQAEFLH